MTNHRLEYWIESVESALEDINKWYLFSKEDIISLAETLQISSEQESMAFGMEHIPNPLEAEIKKINTKHESEIAELERRDFVFRKNVADRHGSLVGPNDVHINGDYVEYDCGGGH